MMNKTLMSLAAAAAIVTGASALATTPAEAGKFSLHIGGHHGFHGHYGYGHGCYTKWKRVRVKVWTYHGWHWRWRLRPYRICY